MFLHGAEGDVADRFRLGFVESTRLNQAIHLGNRQRGNLGRRAGLGEESAGLSVLAKRTSDAATAQMAIHQIELALRTAWDEGRCEIGRVPRGGMTQGSRTFRSAE